MKVLVTGSEGSLMQYVIPRLMKRGYGVVGVDYQAPATHNGSSDVFYPLIVSDLTNKDEVDEIFENEKPDYVIQAAAQIYGVNGFNRKGADILSKDVILHANIMDASVRNNVKRVVYISSSMVYESIPSGDLTEDLPDKFPAPRTGYGLSKYVGEKLCKEYHQQYNLPYTIWRPFNIITPYEEVRGPIGYSHVFADFIQEIVKNGETELPIVGDGNQVRSFTWIGDVADAIAEFSFREESECFIGNIANEEPVTMRELAQRIYDEFCWVRKIEPTPLVFIETQAPAADVKTRIPSNKKVYDKFGWEPKVNLDESIRECVKEAYRKVKW